MAETVQRITVVARSRLKPGPAPKGDGDRTAATIRFPTNHRNYFAQLAADLHVPLGDYVSFIMVKAHALEIPEYLQYIQDRIDGLPEDLQEVLPLALEA